MQSNHTFQQTSNPLPQKLQSKFTKKMLSFHPNPQNMSNSVMSILDKGSKGNQRIYSKKSEQATFIQIQFQCPEDYYRQKLLLQSLSLPKNSSKSDQNNNNSNAYHILNNTNNSYIKNQENNQMNPRYPYLTSWNDTDLSLELDQGLISLSTFKRVREEQNVQWLDKEIQFLMKGLCKIVFEIYNCGVFHGDLCLDSIYLRQNLIGVYEPVLTGFMDATNDYKVVNSFNPDYWNYLNQEISTFSSKEDRLSQELYMVGRIIQKCMLDINSKHEQNLFQNQTNQGIERCLNYFKSQKNSQFTPKTIDCLEILLKKGNIEILIKKFKKFNKDQFITDEEKIIEAEFNNKCFINPPVETIKKVTNASTGQQLTFNTIKQQFTNNNNDNISTQESDCDDNNSEKQKQQQNHQKSSEIQMMQNSKLFKEQVQQEVQLQLALMEMKKQQEQKEQKERETLLKKCEKKKIKKMSIQQQKSEDDEDLLERKKSLEKLQEDEKQSQEYLEKKIIGEDQKSKQEEKFAEDAYIEEKKQNEGVINAEDEDDEDGWDILSQKSGYSSFEEI